MLRLVRAGTILSRREWSLPYSNPVMESRKVRWMTHTVFPEIASLPPGAFAPATVLGQVAFTAGLR
jgi:hypothetical protein